MNAWMNRHPDVTTWIVLAFGMLAALAWSARDEGLAALQWVWLAFAVIGVSGLCAWIISWEADVDAEEENWSDGHAGHGGTDNAEQAPDVARPHPMATDR